ALMGLVKYRRSALAGLAMLLIWPVPVAQVQRPLPPTAVRGMSVQLPGRMLDVGVPTMTPSGISGVVQANVSVTVTNTGPLAFLVQPSDFALSAEGDIFGPAQAPVLSAAGSGMVQHGGSRAGLLTFLVPTATLPRLSLLY